MVPVTFAAASAPISIEMLPHCTLDVGVHDALTVKVLAPAAGSSASAQRECGGLSPAVGAVGECRPKPHTDAEAPRTDKARAKASSHGHTEPVADGRPVFGHGGDADPRGESTGPEATGTMLFGDPISATPTPRAPADYSR